MSYESSLPEPNDRRQTLGKRFKGWLVRCAEEYGKSYYRGYPELERSESAVAGVKLDDLTSRSRRDGIPPGTFTEDSQDWWDSCRLQSEAVLTAEMLNGRIQVVKHEA
ncbi:MAG: hypothetical protein JWN82_479 [Candidatus Saccharibacteria bacterium]|nr:hypothetical protein [Candidatus Saccharibacteria bacterium]